MFTAAQAPYMEEKNTLLKQAVSIILVKYFYNT